MMKLKKYIFGVALGALSLTMASCYNADNDFPDYEGGTTAYFAYQYPVRTLVLGNDVYDNSLDQAHKCQIWSTMGGAYGGRDATVSFIVDETLCNNLYFTDEGGNAAAPVTPMPKNYYSLASDVINYNGDARGYVEVQFTDAFFNDPKAVENTYVIPLLMTSVNGIDHILTGTPREGLSPSRTNTEDWDVLAMDYVLYCVKYMNPWQGKYIRRGADQVTENGVVTNIIRKDTTLVNTDVEHYKENPVNQNDEICGITTKNMTQAIFPVSVRRAANKASVPCNLTLTFDSNNKCTISSDDASVTATGNGEFIENGSGLPEYKDYQWEGIGKPDQRDILRLAYTVTINKGKVLGQDDKGNDILLENDIQVTTADTLVIQTREANKREFFSPKYVKP